MDEETFTISEIIRKKPGYVVGMSGLYVSRMSNGKYHVVSDMEQINEVFESPYQAAQKFSYLRKYLRLGFDFSERPSSEVYLG